MDKIWYRNPSKSEVIGHCGGMKRTNDHAETAKVECPPKNITNFNLLFSRKDSDKLLDGAMDHAPARQISEISTSSIEEQVTSKETNGRVSEYMYCKVLLIEHSQDKPEKFLKSHKMHL